MDGAGRVRANGLKCLDHVVIRELGLLADAFFCTQYNVVCSTNLQDRFFSRRFSCCQWSQLFDSGSKGGEDRCGGLPARDCELVAMSAVDFCD